VEIQASREQILPNMAEIQEYRAEIQVNREQILPSMTEIQENGAGNSSE
jgi:hypothetical protein